MLLYDLHIRFYVNKNISLLHVEPNKCDCEAGTGYDDNDDDDDDDGGGCGGGDGVQ